jgi:hypothetical protein
MAPLDRTAFNALVDDDGSNLVGSPWNKNAIKTVVLDPVDIAILPPSWIDLPYNAANFTAAPGMTWTVAAGNVFVYAYMLEGKKLTLTALITNTTIGGTAAADLRVALPPGLTVAVYGINTAWTTQGSAVVYPVVGQPYVSIYKTDLSPWALGALGQLGFTAILRVA